MIRFFRRVENGWDGFFLPFDSVALGLYRNYRRTGLISSGKIGLLGLYNTSWSEFFDPPLSSIDINAAMLAEAAANCILHNLSNQIFTIKPKLISRREVL